MYEVSDFLFVDRRLESAKVEYMRIESFHIQGFKSLADVNVEGLSDINVFYGLNNVGKSNIFQALALWHRLLSVTTNEISLKQIEVEFGSPIFSLRLGKNKINLQIHLNLDRESELVQNLGSVFSDAGKIRILSNLEFTSSQDKARFQIKNWLESGSEKINPADLSISIPQLLNIHIIQATRRFQSEQRQAGNNLGSISDRNLKQALFYAYLSRDLRQKNRLAAIKRILAEPPFELGELDVALDPETDEIDIGFVRAEGRLPLESMGSGVQQLLLVLGQIFLNDYPIIAIEEPEMNLSPQYQQYLLVALRQLMQDPAVQLSQLFISTHSPYFEFAETFFDVTMDDRGRTQVERLPLEARERYFPTTAVGEENGARLNSLNQVTLYNGMLEDLGLQRGDLVLFNKNEAGRWEIRPEREITQELEAIFDDPDR